MAGVHCTFVNHGILGKTKAGKSLWPPDLLIDRLIDKVIEGFIDCDYRKTLFIICRK